MITIKISKNILHDEIPDLIRKYNGVENPITNGKHIFAYKDGILIGHAEVKRYSWLVSEMCHLFVKPKYRGKGIGEMLFKKQFEIANTPIVFFTTHNDNLAMLKLGAKYKFYPIGVVENVIVNMRFK